MDAMSQNLQVEKFDCFLQVAGHLNRTLHIIPVLYGSLGLSRAIDCAMRIDDIDVLGPFSFIDTKWPELIDAMQALGFALYDAREHAFASGETHIAFAEEEDLLPFAQVDPAALLISKVNGVSFKELTPQQFLAVYRASLLDSYRPVKGKRDSEKISLIEQFLEKRG